MSLDFEPLDVEEAKLVSDLIGSTGALSQAVVLWETPNGLRSGAGYAFLSGRRILILETDDDDVPVSVSSTVDLDDLVSGSAGVLAPWVGPLPLWREAVRAHREGDDETLSAIGSDAGLGDLNGLASVVSSAPVITLMRSSYGASSAVVMLYLADPVYCCLIALEDDRTVAVIRAIDESDVDLVVSMLVS